MTDIGIWHITDMKQLEELKMDDDNANYRQTYESVVVKLENLKVLEMRQPDLSSLPLDY